MDVLAFAFTESAFRHGIDKDTILDVIANPFLFRTHKNGETIMVFGFDANGKAVEVLYDADRRVVFHAMPIDLSKLGKA
jgi:hypothetical protein